MATYLVSVGVALVDEGVVQLDEDLLDVEADQGVVAVGHGDFAGQPKQALELEKGGSDYAFIDVIYEC